MSENAPASDTEAYSAGSLEDFRTILADRLLWRESSPQHLRRSAGDLYLAPHFDDVAFSIGSFTRARGTGRLLTLFSRSDFTLRPDLKGLSIDEVSARRRAEDKAFAKICGLELSDIGLLEAPLRGRDPMNPSKALEDVPVLGPAILAAVLDQGEDRPPRERPWLFAPMALGGHVDHTVVLHILAQNRAAIERRFRLGFYEDLPYAAHYEYRVQGLARFRKLFGIVGWRRQVMPLGPDVAGKLALIGLYESQHRAPPQDITPFTPVRRTASCKPHEAIWIRGRADSA